MKSIRKLKEQEAKHYLRNSMRTDITERPIIPCKKIILSKKDKLKIRGTRAYRQEYERRKREELP